MTNNLVSSSQNNFKVMSSEDTLTLKNESTWWSKRTKTEKYLLITCTISFLIIFILVVSVFIVAQQDEKYDDQLDFCTTPGCIHAASSIIRNMDGSVNPCKDFYEFACGSYIKDNVIPSDEVTINGYVILTDTIRNQLKLLLEEKLSAPTTKSSYLMKTIFDMCMNTTAIEAEGLAPINSLIKEIGGWPILNDNHWDESLFDWKQTLYKLRKFGLPAEYFISLYICADEKNSTIVVLCLDEGSLGLNREFLINGINDKMVQEYYKYMVDVAKYFGVNKSLALSESKDMVEFEIQLAKIRLPKEERRNSTLLYNPMTVAELHRSYPQFPWLEYITNILGVPDVNVTDKDIVVVAVPNYITKLENLLQQTPKRIQANYILSQTITALVLFLNEKLRKREQEYFKVLIGSSEQEDRWKECIDIATESVSLAAGAIYVKNFFSQTAKKHAEELISDLHKEFLKSLEKLEWMDLITKKNAIEKAQSMKRYVGFPDELLNIENVEKHYSKLNIKTDNFLSMGLSILIYYNDIHNSRYRKPINKTEWIAHSFPTVVNAFYDSLENSIEFPAGVLQGSVFSNDRPRYLNYGSLGFAVGHEIIHGFDDKGRQYDKNGNLNDWWNAETKTKFLKKSQCIIDQYGNYSVPEIDMNLNGINTQGENIADNGAIKQAYLAYKNWVKENGKESKLPGLEYTPNQLFWISAANSWCSKDRKEYLKLMVTSGCHSPSKFRVNGPIQNSEYFGTDFNCPIGTPMNPRNKCSIW